MQLERLAEVWGRGGGMSSEMEVLTKGEVGRGGGLVLRLWPAPGDDLIWTQGKAACGAVGDPVAKCGDVPFGINPHPPQRLTPGLVDGRCARWQWAIEEGWTTWVSCFRRPHDGTGFVDPDSAWYVDDTKEGIEQVRLIDQGGVFRRSFFDPALDVGGATGIKGDSDQLEPGGVKLGAQGPPHGQIKAAASPGSPSHQQHFLAAQRRQIKWLTGEIGKLDSGKLGTGQGPASGFWSERPQLMRIIVDERHPKPPSKHRQGKLAIGRAGGGR
jgi:hypothetical protein